MTASVSAYDDSDRDYWHDTDRFLAADPEEVWRDFLDDFFNLTHAEQARRYRYDMGDAERAAIDCSKRRSGREVRDTVDQMDDEMRAARLERAG